MDSVCINRKNEYLESFNSLFYNKLREHQAVNQCKIVRKRKISNAKYQKEIDRFQKNLIDNFKPEYLKRFNDNINTLKIVKKVTKYKHRDTIATYNSHTNVIELLNEESIYHELFHMSSSLITNESNELFVTYDFVGLKDQGYGKGLNEGYTQILSERYFNDKPSYIRLVDIMKAFEYMIGEEKMHSFYFETGLKGLTDELKTYLSDYKDLMLIYRFIHNMDDLVIHNYKGKDNDQSIISIYEALFEMYYRILLKKIDDGELTEEQALYRFDSLRFRLFSKYSSDTYYKVRPDEMFDYEHVMKEVNEKIDWTRGFFHYKLNMHKKTRK